MEAVHKSLDVSHVWITKFVKLPKDSVGSFIMTFSTNAVADLLGVEEANAADRPQNERDPEGVSSSQADIQARPNDKSSRNGGQCCFGPENVRAFVYSLQSPRSLNHLCWHPLISQRCSLLRQPSNWQRTNKSHPYVKDLQAQTQKGLTVFEMLRRRYSPVLGYERPR